MQDLQITWKVRKIRYSGLMRPCKFCIVYMSSHGLACTPSLFARLLMELKKGCWNALLYPFEFCLFIYFYFFVMSILIDLYIYIKCPSPFYFKDHYIPKPSEYGTLWMSLTISKVMLLTATFQTINVSSRA